MKLYTVRHPEPMIARGKCYGASDIACEPSVLESAAGALRHAVPEGLEVISSPLQRCERLAHHLYGLRPDLPYKTDARLAEMDFGDWELCDWDAIDPQALSDWTDHFAHARCGGHGESAGQMVQRVASRLSESWRAGKDQLWVTHAGVIRALQWLVCQPPALINSLADPCRVYLGIARLRAADWPQTEVAWSRLQQWDWPPPGWQGATD